MAKIICGVDVSSDSLAARMGPDGARAVFPNTPEGIAQLAAFCCARQAELVAMEATGGYEQQPFLLLSAQGLSVAILNPRQVRRFAEGMGRMEKIDAIDAGLIAWFAEVKRSRPSPPPAPPQNRPAVYPLPGAQSKDPPKIRGPRRAGFARWGGRKGVGRAAAEKDLTRKTFLLSSWVPRVSILRPGKRAKRAAQRALPVDPLVLLREE